MKRNILIALLAAFALCGCTTDLTDTYWRNAETGEWVMGITEDNLVYDSKVWDITSRSEAGDTYIIEARCGQETIKVSIGGENDGKCTIAVNGKKTVCSLFDDEYLPDYPVEDTTPLANNNYAEGDSVTITGWIKPCPPHLKWLRDKISKNKDDNEVKVRIASLYSNKETVYSTTTDSLGRFTLRIPLENTTFFYLHYPAGYTKMVAEPGETYFLMADPMLKKTLFMGQNARVQNELNAHFLEVKELSCRDVEEKIKDLDKLRDSVTVLKKENLGLLDKTIKEHPTLSEKYKTFARNRILGAMADNMMMGEFLSGKMPASYLKDVEDLYCSQMDPLCMLMPDDHEYFPQYYWWRLQRIAEEWELTNVPKALDKSERVQIFTFSPEEQVRILEATLAAMQKRGWNKTAQDIYLCRELCSRIDRDCGPLDKCIMDFADANIQLPAARNVLYAATEKWQDIGKEKKPNANMSEGEKLLRKLCEPYKGRPIMLDIWGTWCGPCLADLKECQEEYKQLKDYDLVYMYLAWDSKEEDCQKVIEQYNVKGLNVVHHTLTTKEQNALENYLGIHSWPFYRLIDRNGNLIDVELHPYETEKVKKILDKLK